MMSMSSILSFINKSMIDAEVASTAYSI
jgi:hypothetical protein